MRQPWLRGVPQSTSPGGWMGVILRYFRLWLPQSLSWWLLRSEGGVQPAALAPAYVPHPHPASGFWLRSYHLPLRPWWRGKENRVWDQFGSILMTLSQLLTSMAGFLKIHSQNSRFRIPCHRSGLHFRLWQNHSLGVRTIFIFENHGRRLLGLLSGQWD